MKRFLLILILFIFVMGDSVFAMSFSNKNGVSLTEREYQFVNEFYGEDFFQEMKISDYEWIKDLNVEEREYVIHHSINKTRDTVHVTDSKRLSITKTCSGTFCTIITKLEWFINPNIRSYDVIGARFVGCNLANQDVEVYLTSSQGGSYSSSHNFFSNGFGSSVLLPYSSNIMVQQKFNVSSGGIVFASYQHAQRTFPR